MLSSKMKTEPEEAEICLPAHHHLHSSSLDSHSTLGGALESTKEEPPESELLPDCVKTKSDPSPVRSSDQKEEAINSGKKQEVLRLSESEVSRARFCHTFMYKRIEISNGGTKCPTDVDITFSEPNTSHGTNSSQGDKDSNSEDVWKKIGQVKNKENGKKNNFCQLCERGYVNKYKLNLHMKTHTGVRNHRCEECGTAFLQKDSLKAHMRIHSGERPFCCDQCDKSFASSGNLIEHKKYCHTECDSGERRRSFVCTECGKGCIRASDLKRHMMTHTGEKPFACTLCGSRFQRSCGLKKHMRIHTRERPYYCSDCGKTFPYAFSYSTHRKLHSR